MEGKKSTGSADSSSTSSSIVSQLFGSKESSAPATESSSSGRSGIFDSVFAMPERQTSQFEGLGTWRKQDHQVWSSRPATSDSIFHSSSSENKVEPCFLSSSLFYGGREYCPPPKSASETNKMYRDDDPDEKDSASRGNWWKVVSATKLSAPPKTMK
ncbi:hypothetical protein QJS10_CPA03g01764 [Acorus calamus]|uniref:Uncharacterized protein n=1 Tax=Acorus calamus TaxID=4465 RepID=A0AAV9F5B2_ACOCL|nr:hypothetical protein QJS10_CPA03g01764 [Acorus calamus]